MSQITDLIDAYKEDLSYMSDVRKTLKKMEKRYSKNGTDYNTAYSIANGYRYENSDEFYSCDNVSGDKAVNKSLYRALRAKISEMLDVKSKDKEVGKMIRVYLNRSVDCFGYLNNVNDVEMPDLKKVKTVRENMLHIRKWLSSFDFEDKRKKQINLPANFVLARVGATRFVHDNQAVLDFMIERYGLRKIVVDTEFTAEIKLMFKSQEDKDAFISKHKPKKVA